MPPEPVFSCRTAVVAGITLLLIFVGCMSFEGSHVDRVETVAAPPEAPESNVTLVADGPFEQEGWTSIPGGCEQDVYYPIPFVSPPFLDLQGNRDHVQLIGQRHDRFRVKNLCTNRFELARIHWAAKGIKAQIVAGTPVVPPPRLLPGEPTPVSPQP